MRSLAKGISLRHFSMMFRALSCVPQRHLRIALLCTIAILIVTLFKLNAVKSEEKKEVMTVPPTTTSYTVNDPKLPYEVYIRSAYYYPISESLGKNAIALVYHADFAWEKETKELMIRSWNDTANQISSCKIEIMNPWHDKLCQLVAIYSSCQVIGNMKRLQISLGNEYQDIPFEVVSYQKKDVVTCISPLFAAEQWQLVAFAAHNYKRFGSFMHLYVRSMLKPVYELTKVYEKEGYLKLQPWTRIVFSSVPDYMYNPNQNVAFRSQEGAQTDCLLQYKESAEFVTFMDLDDILIPRFAPTYVEEFRLLIPKVNYVHYEKQNVYYEASMEPQLFSMEQIFKTSRFTNITETGKYATRPRLVNYTAIHYPTIEEQKVAYTVPKEENVIVHLKKMFPLGSAHDERKLWPYVFNTNISTIFKETDVIAIEEDFRRIYSKYAAEWLQQPTSTVYVQHIANCYHMNYYRHWNYNHPEGVKKCTNPDICRVPQSVKVPCANADGEFFSTEHGTSINLHYARSQALSLCKLNYSGICERLPRVEGEFIAYAGFDEKTPLGVEVTFFQNKLQLSQ